MCEKTAPIVSVTSLGSLGSRVILGVKAFGICFSEWEPLPRSSRLGLRTHESAEPGFDEQVSRWVRDAWPIVAQQFANQIRQGQKMQGRPG